MKIAAKSVSSFLARPGECPAILLYGPDDGLIRDRAERLREEFLGKEYDPFALVELDPAQILQEPTRLDDEIRAVHMMAPRRVLLIRQATDKLSKILREGFPALHGDIRLLVLAGDLTPRSTLRSLFEADKAAAAVACYHDEQRDIAGVIREKLAAEKIVAERDALEYLASQMGNDRYVTYQELDKIITYLGEEKKLTLETSRQLVDYNRDMQLDDLINAVADRDMRRLDQLLLMYEREALSPVSYIRGLLRYYNRLYSIHAQLGRGASLDTVISSLKPKVFFKQEAHLRRHVAEWKMPRIVRAMALLGEAELACKSSDLPAQTVTNRKLMQITQAR